MKNIIIPNQAAPTKILKNTRQTSDIPTIDITRGARLHGIRSSAVLMESEIFDSYGELDPALGQNLAGVILALLACHLEMNPGGTHEDQITICAIRRDDSTTVELNLLITRKGRQEGEQIVLHKGNEREVDTGVIPEHRFTSHSEQNTFVGRL